MTELALQPGSAAMDIDPHSSRSFSNACNWILLLLLLLLQPALARAGESRPPARVPTIVVSTPLSTPLFAKAWSWRSLFNPVQSALGNRRHMIQFATIGMCIGLYILMRK
jgi:hypothetical protein